MESDIHHERVADGKVCIGATLPRALVARVDLAVAFRHLRDDWVTRVEVVEGCLVRFFAFGGLGTTTTRPRCNQDDREIFRLNLDYELACAVCDRKYRPPAEDDGIGDRIQLAHRSKPIPQWTRAIVSGQAASMQRTGFRQASSLEFRDHRMLIRIASSVKRGARRRSALGSFTALQLPIPSWRPRPLGQSWAGHP